MKWGVQSLLLLAVFSVFFIMVPVEGLFSLNVLVGYYSNTLNTTFNNECCREDCSACDSIFLFCMRPAGFDPDSDECPWGSYSSAGFPVTSNSKVFSFGNLHQDVGNISNPMEFVGDRWSGSFQLLVRVDHYYSSGSSVLIDRVFAEQGSFDLGFSFSDLTVFEGNHSNVMMFLRFRAMCQPDYYGAQCEVYCIREDGLYVCNNTRDTMIVVCPAELVQGVFYEETPSGVSVENGCPQPASPSEGVAVVGSTNRTCLLNGTWSEIDTSGCFESRIDFQILSQQATMVFDQPTENIDPQAVQNLIIDLLRSTNPSVLQGGSHFMEDLKIATNVLNQSIDYLLFNLEDETTPLEFDENVFDVINNVLDENNAEGWNDLQMNEVGSESVLLSAEMYGQYVAQAIRSDRVDTGVVSEKELERRNIILNAATVSNNEDYVYPVNVNEEQTFAQSVLSSNVLLDKGENYSIVNILFTNLDMFLPDAELESMTNGTIVGSSVISTQVLSSDNRKITAINAPAEFRFKTRQIQLSKNETIKNVRCVFWNFTSGADISESTWSEAGIETTLEPKDDSDDDNTRLVTCKSDHLTSFAVLLDVHGVLDNITAEERLALEIVTYVGLGVSILLLLLTILILLCLDLRKLFREELLYFIHLNLSTALLFANVTFIAGIDTAVDNRYACVVVAGLLHYLYTAAFYWMLCEGIMLYFKVVITMNRVSRYLSNKWWFFFLIGWGVPIIPVAISIGVIHEQYGNDRYCWITLSDHKGGSLWAFVIPFAVVIVLNSFIFAAALIRIFNSRKAKLEHSDSRAQKMCRLLIYNGLSILPLLGLTWVFGLLAINQATSVFLWLFTIFNSLQGAMIFFFQIIRNPKIWKTLKKKRNARKSQTQSTGVTKTSNKKSKVTSSSSINSRGNMVSGQHVSYTKSTSVTKLKPSADSENPSLSFSDPLDVDTMTKEDFNEELFETT